MPSARRFRMKLSALPALLIALFFLGFATAPSAQAQSAGGNATLTVDDPRPATGSPVGFTTTIQYECAAASYTFTVDGTARTAQTSDTLREAFATTGDHTVSVEVALVYAGGNSCGTATATKTITVGPGVTGTINVSPDPPRPGEAATLSVTPSGGLGSPYAGYRWEIDGVADPAGNDKRTFTRTFATAGPHTVKVTLRDDPDPTSPNPSHSGSASRTITAEVAPPPPPGSPPPAPGAPPPAPPAPPPCTKTVAFALSQFKTDGCFEKTGSNPDRWETTAQVRLNGIPFADSGQRFLITGPTASEPGGHVKSDNAALQLDRFIPFSGNVDWSLPGGKEGEEEIGTLREVAVPEFTRLFKLRVAGSIAIKLQLSGGQYSAAFPMNVELPPAFTAGPSKFSGGVSGAASIRVDDDGIKYDGLKIAVSDVWVGRLKVVSACFSYVPAGGQALAPCEAPELDGKPYIQCATDATTERFDGSAVIELPTASSTQLAAFGGLADGRVSKLGGFVDQLGTTVPIVPGIFLNRVGVGLCLSPPPFKLRGDVGVNALGGKLAVNGRFLYTDATDTTPWLVEVGGNVKFNGTQLGDAQVGFNAWGDVSFDVNAGIDLAGVASIKGNVGGWIEPRNSTFNITGSVQGCITGLTCATASGLISSSGIAGCLDLGTITIDVPSGAKQGPFGFGSISFTTRKETYILRGGVGYRYGGRVSLLGNSCDFAPYAATRSTGVQPRAAGRALSERIQPGTKALSLRIPGSSGPPKVVVRGPDGTKITSPANGTATQRKGRYVLAENPSESTTSVLLIKPAAGTWTVEAAPSAASTPTRLDVSDFEAPPVLLGQVRRRGDGNEAAVQYAVPAGATVRLAERAKGIGRTIGGALRGKPCRGVPTLPDGRTLLCTRVRFTPSRGPGGTRRIEAMVSRDGVPLAKKSLASFKAPRERAPSQPGRLRVVRDVNDVVVVFPTSRGASRYTASVTLADGRQLGYDLAGSCRAVRIPSVTRADAVRVKVAGVRYDLKTGKYAKATLLPNRRWVGGSGKVPRRICS